MLSSKVVFSPLTNSVKCSGLLFSNLLNASFRLPTNSKPFSTKLYRLLNWNRNPQNVRGIGKKFQWNSFPKFKRENRINSLNFTVLGSSVVKFYSGRYHSYNWNYSYLLSAVFVSACNNNQSDNNSTSENTDDHFSDLEFVRRLTEKTLICKSCHLRIRVDHKLPNVEYCKCYDGRAMETSFGGWKPFIERPSGLVWRKEHESYKGLFAYKMHGRLEDVSALDFVRVQLDTNFRKKWDTSASELLVIEENSQSNYDVIYWEMQWPKPFAKRDYVFLRKLTYDPERNVCIISSVATSHPSFPAKKSSHRVKEYWSYMAIRPFDDFKKPGLEFVVTYFDNPGLSIPSSMSSWVAMTALPTFVSNLHNATLKVSELEGPEPTLLRCLLQQLEARLDVADTLIDEEESIVLQLDPSPINEEMQMTLECSSTSENKPSEKSNPAPPNDEATAECTPPTEMIPSGEENPSPPNEEVQLTVEHTSNTGDFHSEEGSVQRRSEGEATEPQPITVEMDSRNQPEESTSPVFTESISVAAGETLVQLPQKECSENEVEMQSKRSGSDQLSSPPPPPLDEKGTDQDITGS